MELRLARGCLLALLVIAWSDSTSISALDAGERLESYSHGVIVNDAKSSSSHGSNSSQQQRIRLSRRLFSRHNELGSTESARKTAAASSSSTHMLIGGHLRGDTNTAAETGARKESNLEDGLLLSSAGNGKERKSSTSSGDDDDKKTLSQQVKEGKYGLIQNELFADEPKRPGIISYASNPEVPRDNLKSLGGLDEEEIWLAEDHVLVIKGGNFPKEDAPEQQSQSSWKPIDDYQAPQRQVKIPAQPRVPPPFPVQLTEGGPVQLIGANGTSLVENGTIDFEALPEGFKGFLPGEGPFFPLPPPNASEPIAGPEKKTKAEGLPGPFYASLPPGAVIVPPPSNQTDYDDEDQSIYYPPPYSFVYPKDNSTDIPPGPLVPGIILPPPPDFFSALDEKKPTGHEGKYGKRPSGTTPLPPPQLPTAGRPSYSPPRKSSTKLYKTPSVTSTPVGSKTAAYNTKYSGRPKLKNTTYQTEKSSARSYPTLLPFIEVTTPVPVKSTTLESPEKYRHIQPILSNQVIDSSSEKAPWRTALVSSKAVPLVTFFATTTPSSIEQPVETTPAVIKTILTTESPTRYPSQASYYFYEEAGGANNNNNNNNEKQPSSTPEPVIFIGTTAETPPYYNLELSPQEPQQQQQQQSELQQPELQQQQQPRRDEEEEKKDYYDVEMIPPQQTSKDYNVKLIDSVVKNPQIYRYLDSGATSSQDKYETTPVRSQSPRMLHSEPLYYQPVPTRSSPKLSYFTTPKPKNYYQRPQHLLDDDYVSHASKPSHKPKPIYQYSFEATNYKRGRQASSALLPQKPELDYEQPQIQQPRRQKELPLYNEYQDIQTVAGGADQYDYENSEPLLEHQQVQTEKLPAYHHHQHRHLGAGVSPSSSSSGKKQLQQQQRSYYQHQSTTISPVRETTLAAHQQYFTKQDEQLLDEVTKEYFTMFGKKLPSTTPIYGKSSVTERPSYVGGGVNGFGRNEYAVARQPPPPPPPPAAPPANFHAQNIKVHYGDQTPGPFSLKDDILVNYKQPLPSLEPEAEFVPLQKYRARPQPVLRLGPGQLQGYGLQRYEQPHQPERYEPEVRAPVYQPARLDADLAVNFKSPRPGLNPDAEFLGPGPGKQQPQPQQPANSYFAYRLPGDGGHFYFLTPQAISREDANAGFLYTRPRASRLLRRRRGREAD